MNPICSLIVELPIRVDVRLLHGVVSSHADMQRDDICLRVGEGVGRAWEMSGPAIDGENVSGYIVAGAHFLEELRVALGDHAELRVTVSAGRGTAGAREVWGIQP